MAKRVKRKKKTSKIIIIIIFLAVIIFVFNIASNNFIGNDVKDKKNLIINNCNVTEDLKADVYIQDEIIYLSKADVVNFFDDTIIYNEQYDHLITCSNKKTASLPIGKKQIEVNSATVQIEGETLKKEDDYYIPISELGDVYNIKTAYSEETNIVTVDFLDKEYKIATVSKDIAIKLKPTNFSKTVAKVQKGETLIIANHSDYPVSDKWARVRTENGVLGYVKVDKMGEWNVIREEIKNESKDESSITWVQEQKYQVSSLFSKELPNNTVNEILQDYKLREKMINSIIDYIITEKLGGIHIDLENMSEVSKDSFSRFIIELKPRLNEIGSILLVSGELY